MKIDFKNIKIGPQKFPATKKINPHRHWTVLLNIFFVIIIILILLSLFLSYKIKNQKIFQVEMKPKENSSIINEKLLNRVDEYFNKKSLRENEIQNNLKDYEDPSL